MIYRTEIYNGYVLGEARGKKCFSFFFYKAFFLVEGHCNPRLVNPRLFNYEFFNPKLFNHLYLGLKSQLGKLGVEKSGIANPRFENSWFIKQKSIMVTCGEKPGKKCFSIFLWSFFFWLKDITTPDFSTPRLFIYEFFNPELFNHGTWPGSEKSVGETWGWKDRGCNSWT